MDFRQPVLQIPVIYRCLAAVQRPVLILVQPHRRNPVVFIEGSNPLLIRILHVFQQTVGIVRILRRTAETVRHRGQVVSVRRIGRCALDLLCRPGSGQCAAGGGLFHRFRQVRIGIAHRFVGVFVLLAEDIPKKLKEKFLQFDFH